MKRYKQKIIKLMNKLLWTYGKLYIVHWVGLEARKHRFLNKVQYKIKGEWINLPKHLRKEFPFNKNDQE